MSTTTEKNGLAKRLPTADEITSAAHAATAIAVSLEVGDGLKVAGIDGPVKIAPAVGRLIVELLGHVANGNMVTLVPTGTLLTTQEAADMLNVSRPHLSKLLKEGVIAHVPVGRHRRVPLDALLQYREDRGRAQDDALDELAKLGQDYDAA